MPPADVDAASIEGPKALHLLAVNRVLLPQGRHYTLEAAAGEAGIPVEDARRVWWALGFLIRDRASRLSPRPMSSS